MSILRETTVIDGTAQLTLRLRDGDPPDPALLRVLRKDPKTGIGQLEVGPDKIQIVDFKEGKGKGVSFPITRFGSFVVAMERDR